VPRPRQFDPDTAVDAAKELFWSKGYGATTPSDLVDALGIGKGSLYNAFESKGALFERALRRYGDERIAGLEAVLAGPGPVRARLEKALTRLASTDLEARLRRGCLAVNTSAELGDRDDAVARIVRSVFERMERALRAAIALGQEAGEIRADHDPRALASLLVTTMIGMTVVARTADPTNRARRAVQALMSMI
jgi:TetR/AcrR family transcriptional repressor of nem operon